MPNYAPFCTLKLIANAYEAKDEKPLDISYGGFWDTFYKAPKENSLRCMMRALFSGLGIQTRIVVVSVFGTMHMKTLQKEKGILYVGFSGEPHSLNPSWFDINLIMEPSNIEKGIVCLPNFATNAYEFGLWPYLQMPRPEYPFEKKKFCTFVVRNGGCGIRNKFMQMLSKYRSVDCAGSYMNNLNGKTAPEDELVYGDGYLGFLQQYRFMICFENTKKPGYITEKLLNAYMAGCIPIYWGSPQVLEWLNPNAFLFLSNETDMSMQALVDTVRFIDQNEEAYWKMYREPLLRESGIPKEWRIESLREQIQACLKQKV